jgi:hypothetical protein
LGGKESAANIRFFARDEDFLAQPPTTDVNETFLREVDENLRRDRVRDFFVAQKVALIAALVLFLAAAGGWIWYQDYRRKQAGDEIEQLSLVYKDISENKLGTVPARLDTLAKSDSDAVRASALFTRGALAIDQRDLPLASRVYGQIAADDSLPQPYRDAGLLRQVAVDFDKMKPDQVIAKLAPLAKPGAPFYGTAAEMTAAAMIKQGKTAEAGKLFAGIAADKSLPDTLRGRAVQLAGSLGVDASGAFDPAPLQE